MEAPSIKPEDIPYVGSPPKDGRNIVLYPFYDQSGIWHAFVPKGDGTLFELNPIQPVSSAYLAKAAVDARRDVYMPLSDLVLQHFSFANAFEVMTQIEHDYLNAFAVLHKYFVLLHHANQSKTLYPNVVVRTELEFTLANHRAFYDRLNALLQRLYARFIIHDEHGRPVSVANLPDSFRRVVDKGAGDLKDKFHFPQPLIDFYLRRADCFGKLRKIRDDITHHGHTPQFVFSMDDGFAISLDDKMWQGLVEFGVWPQSLLKPNRLGSVLGLLLFLVNDMEEAMSELAKALRGSFAELPPAVAPGWHVFLRDHLLVHHGRLAEYRRTHWFDATAVLEECRRCWHGLETEGGSQASP
jgi:hypothetical protein